MSVKTIAEIEQIREATLKKIGARFGMTDFAGARIHIMTCGGAGCHSSGTGRLLEKFRELAERDGMGEEVCAVRTGCFGLCSDGPIIVIQPENIMYAKVQPEDVEEIWESHIKRGKPVERLVSKNEKAFFSKQQRIALKNCGRIDPENIDEYIAAGGYAALIKVLNGMEPEDVIDIVKKSGIRGRGGGGFQADGTRQDCVL